MKGSKKYLAFLAYLVPVLGWLYILIAERKDRFSRYHAKQSLVLTLALVGAVLVWLVLAWVLTWLPFVGPIIAAFSFTLVALVWVVVVVDWIVGMVYALRVEMKPVPLLGGWGEKLPFE